MPNHRARIASPTLETQCSNTKRPTPTTSSRMRSFRAMSSLSRLRQQTITQMDPFFALYHPELDQENLGLCEAEPQKPYHLESPRPSKRRFVESEAERVQAIQTPSTDGLIPVSRLRQQSAALRQFRVSSSTKDAISLGTKPKSPSREFLTTPKRRIRREIPSSQSPPDSPPSITRDRAEKHVDLSLTVHHCEGSYRDMPSSNFSARLTAERVIQDSMEHEIMSQEPDSDSESMASIALQEDNRVSNCKEERPIASSAACSRRSSPNARSRDYAADSMLSRASIEDRNQDISLPIHEPSHRNHNVKVQITTQSIETPLSDSLQIGTLDASSDSIDPNMTSLLPELPAPMQRRTLIRSSQATTIEDSQHPSSEDSDNEIPIIEKQKHRQSGKQYTSKTSPLSHRNKQDLYEWQPNQRLTESQLLPESLLVDLPSSSCIVAEGEKS